MILVCTAFRTCVSSLYDTRFSWTWSEFEDLYQTSLVHKKWDWSLLLQLSHHLRQVQMYQQPGPTPNYRQHDFTFTPDQSQIYNGGDHKTQGVRFKPKNRLNDPVFLIFFVLQVRLLSFHLPYKATVFVVSRIHRFVWHSPDNMDITRRFGGRPWCGWRSNGQSSYIEQVLHFILTFLLLYFCQ